LLGWPPGTEGGGGWQGPWPPSPQFSKKKKLLGRNFIFFSKNLKNIR